MSKFFMGLTRNQIIERLTAEDIRTVIINISEGDYAFLRDIIQGNSSLAYRYMTPDSLQQEYHERYGRIEQLIEDGEMPYIVG